MWGYWRRVIARAYRDARQAVGHNWTKTIVGAMGTAAAFGIFGYLEGGPKVYEKAEWWLSVLLGALLVFVAVLLYQILAAPVRLETEAAAAAKEEGRDAERSEWCRQLGEAAAREQQLREAHAAELEKARNSDPHRNAVRRTIVQFIGRFEAVAAQAAAGTPVPAKELYPIETEALHYLRQNLPAYRDFSADFPIVGTYQTGAVLMPQEAALRCSARTARLREVLELLQ